MVSLNRVASSWIDMHTIVIMGHFGSFKPLFCHNALFFWGFRMPTFKCSSGLKEMPVWGSNRDYTACVGHFGSVRAAKVSQCTLVKTLGFVDPEYGVTGKLTEKSDVFSYGMLLLVLISGRRMLESQPSGNPQHTNKQFSCYKTGMQ